MRKTKTKSKKPSLHTKVGKYFMAIQEGKPKTEAQIIAGYAGINHSAQIEKTQEFQALTSFFKDSFLQKMSMDELSDALIDNIKQTGQERLDRAARNGAIKIALDKLEPENQKTDTQDKVLIVLSK